MFSPVQSLSSHSRKLNAFNFIHSLFEVKIFFDGVLMLHSRRLIHIPQNTILDNNSAFGPPYRGTGAYKVGVSIGFPRQISASFSGQPSTVSETPPICIRLGVIPKENVVPTRVTTAGPDLGESGGIRRPHQIKKTRKNWFSWGLVSLCNSPPTIRTWTE